MEATSLFFNKQVHILTRRLIFKQQYIIYIYVSFLRGTVDERAHDENYSKLLRAFESFWGTPYSHVYSLFTRQYLSSYWQVWTGKYECVRTIRRDKNKAFSFWYCAERQDLPSDLRIFRSVDYCQIFFS